VDQRDVFLDEFADTDDEVEIDEEEVEKEIRREERRKAKGKGKAAFIPLVPRPKTQVHPVELAASSPGASSSAVTLHDSSIDAATMAPSTLVLALRKQRREAKRLNRSEARRSTMRASTLRTEKDVIDREAAEKVNPNRKGRRAQHETGEIRVVHKMTQDELIAAALEEEERNKEELQKWLRKEEERRELRRVGRKRVRGPRWTWISRTVGKLVEVVNEEADGKPESHPNETLHPVATEEADSTEAGPEAESGTKTTTEDRETPVSLSAQASAEVVTATTPQEVVQDVPQPTHDADQPAEAALDKTPSAQARHDEEIVATITAPNVPDIAPTASPAPAEAVPKPIPSPSATPAPILPPDEDTSTGQYMRNYLILSQVPGGLPAELKLILGDHVEWDGVQFIPARNRPINRRPPTCPFTGRPAKYRHPTTMIPYSNPQGYREIEALLANRYVWSDEGGCWMGGEEDVMAEGVDEVEGWREAVMGGWLAGEQLVEEVQEEEEVAEEPLPEPEPQPEPEPEVVEEIQAIPASKSKKRKAPAAEKSTKSAGKGKKRKPSMPAAAEEIEADVEVLETLEPIIQAKPKGKSKSKGKGKR
jgi:hypothetical protein